MHPTTSTPSPIDTDAQRLAVEVLTGPLDPAHSPHRPMPWALVWLPHIGLAASLVLWVWSRA